MKYCGRIALVVCAALLLTVASAAPCSHNWEMTEVTMRPTCDKDAYYVITCALCGAKEKVVTDPALGHDYGDWTYLIDPTDHSTGTRQRTCMRCGKVSVSEYFPLGTQYVSSTHREEYRETEKMLLELGFFGGTPDDLFDEETQNAVRAFQSSQGLEETGIAFPQTLEVLKKVWTDAQNSLEPEMEIQETVASGVPSDEEAEFPFCIRVVNADGEESIEWCASHREIADLENLLLSAANTESERLTALKTVRILWQNELDRLSGLLAQLPGENSGANAQVMREMFNLYLTLQENALRAELTEIGAEQAAIEIIKIQCADWCAEINE